MDIRIGNGYDVHALADGLPIDPRTALIVEFKR